MMILNEFKYTLGKAGYLSMYDTVTGEMVLRMPKEALLELPSGGLLGRKGFRMIEGEELGQVIQWVQDV